MLSAKERVEPLTRYSGTDLDDLCEATESAIVEGGGFGWLKPPPRQVLGNYWKGGLLGPGRPLVVGPRHGVVAGWGSAGSTGSSPARPNCRARRATTRRRRSPGPSAPPLSHPGRAAAAS